MLNGEANCFLQEVVMQSNVKPDAMQIIDSPPSLTHAGTSRSRILSPLICTIGASVGVFGGFAMLLTGLVFAVISAASSDRSFDRAGTILLIAALPAILIGAMFLDEINLNN